MSAMQYWPPKELDDSVQFKMLFPFKAINVVVCILDVCTNMTTQYIVSEIICQFLIK